MVYLLKNFLVHSYLKSQSHVLLIVQCGALFGFGVRRRVEWGAVWIGLSAGFGARGGAACAVRVETDDVIGRWQPPRDDLRVQPFQVRSVLVEGLLNNDHLLPTIYAFPYQAPSRLTFTYVKASQHPRPAEAREEKDINLGTKHPTAAKMPLVVPGMTGTGGGDKTDEWNNKLAGKTLSEEPHSETVRISSLKPHLHFGTPFPPDQN